MIESPAGYVGYGEDGARNIENMLAKQILPLLSAEILKQVGKKGKISSAYIGLNDKNS